MSPQIEKQQFKNNTGGWLGVVLIGPRGEDRGGSVPPNGTVWLSEQEQTLTANAPRDAKDNPFIEHEMTVIDRETGEPKVVTVTPLTPISENRYVPAQDRFVPGVTASDARAVAEANAAAQGDTPEVVVGEQPNAQTRHDEVAEQGPSAAPRVPAKAAAATAAADARLAASKGERPAKPSNDREPDSEGPQGGRADRLPGKEDPVEETAATVNPDVGEETGAAPLPTGPAPEGEYAAHEEVGTPVGTESASTPVTPYVPADEE